MATITQREFLMYRKYHSKPVETEKTDVQKDLDMLAVLGGELSPEDADEIMRATM